MSSLQRTKAWLGTARYLARHPQEARRVPRWFPQRSLSPMAIRVPWWPYDAITWLAGHRPSPFWGRAAEIVDMVLVIALVPLALGVAGVFSDIRGLSG